MSKHTAFVLKNTLDEYIENPLTGSQIQCLRENKKRWDRAAKQLNTALSFAFALAMLGMCWALAPDGSLTKLSLPMVCMVIFTSVMVTSMAYLSFYPISFSLTFSRHRVVLNVESIEFTAPEFHRDTDFDDFKIDRAKIAHHEKAVRFLDSIENMQRTPVGFEYRLIKDMITL